MPNVNPNNSGLPQIAVSGIERQAKPSNKNTVAKLDRKATLSQTEIAELWIIQGGDPRKADEASAVSMAESGGRAKVHTPGSCCYGLYQFHHLYFPVKCAVVPSCATKMAIKLSENGTSWDGGKWEAHENGSYKKFLGKSHVLGQGEGISLRGPEELVGKITDPIAGIVGFLGRLFEPSFWLRVGKGILGFLLLLFGALTLMKVLVGVDIPTGVPAKYLKGALADAAGM